jgi:hypothetical protein
MPAVCELVQQCSILPLLPVCTELNLTALQPSTPFTPASAAVSADINSLWHSNLCAHCCCKSLSPTYVLLFTSRRAGERRF